MYGFSTFNVLIGQTLVSISKRSISGDNGADSKGDVRDGRMFCVEGHCIVGHLTSIKIQFHCLECGVLCFVEKIHARNIKCIPFFTPLPSLLFLVVSCFCAACLREEFGGWGPFYLIADLRVFSVWCMLAWKFIFSTKHCKSLGISFWQHTPSHLAPDCELWRSSDFFSWINPVFHQEFKNTTLHIIHPVRRVAAS